MANSQAGRQDGKAVCSTVCIFEANPTAVADDVGATMDVVE